MARSQLASLVRECLHQRKSSNEFNQILGFAIKRWKSTGPDIIAGLVSAVAGFCLDNDVLISGYLQVILISHHAQFSDCLYVFIRHWQVFAANNGAQTSGYVRLLAQMITDLAVTIPSIPLTPAQARKNIIWCSRWLQALFKLATAGAKHNDEHITLLVTALSGFLLTTLNIPAGLTAVKAAQDDLDDPLKRAVREAIHGSMTAFPDISMQLLSEAHKHPALDETIRPDTNNSQASEMAAINFENNVANSQIVPTRVATYVLLYDKELWNDLTALASPEALAIAKHFLHICILHQMISSETVQKLTGEDPNATTAKGLFPRQALVDQVSANATRAPRLVEELCKNDGNAGSFSQAIVQVMHRYCQTRDTQHLKEIANVFVRQPQAINSLTMFVTPTFFLAPFCTLLDEWTWDDIHGESQPVYEEFGSILLLIMTVKFRLGLRNEELGLTSHSGFVAHFLASGQSEKFLSQMSDSEKSNLGAWIHNLYESEGISDEVTSNCSAKEFYLMVPTLLRQSMAALAAGTLPQDRLEGGLDYLLEPFLLPSLLPSFEWLSQAILKDRKSAAIILRRLARSPENAETSKLHRTIMDIASVTFKAVLGQSSEKSQYADILELFDGPASFSVNSGVSGAELTGWTHEHGGSCAYLQKAVRDLIAIPNTGLYQPNIVSVAMSMRGPAGVIQALVTVLVQYAANNNFHQMLDIVATLVACRAPIGITLRNSLQLLHARLASLLKSGDPLFPQATVHLYRRVELYANALRSHAGIDENPLDNLDGMELPEIDLDQVPVTLDESKKQPAQTTQPETLANDALDQILTETAEMNQMDNYEMNDDNNIFVMDQYELGDIGDLDMTMF
ncbi:mediator complex subunit [Lithohypha guttulata]|nr:mediator complex subunit [Lithohypha guttulata]